MCGVRVSDRRSFERLYRRHQQRALRVANSICHDAQRAEEVVQDSFFSIWRARGGYRPTGIFRAWMTGIVRHRALDSLRVDAAQKRPTLILNAPLASEPASDSLPDALIAEEQTQALRHSISRLPPTQAEVVKLAFFDELSHNEIAARLDLPAGTVKGRMRLGLEKLRGRKAKTVTEEQHVA